MAGKIFLPAKTAVHCHNGRNLFLAEGISAHYRTVTIYPPLADMSRGFTQRVHAKVTGPCKTRSPVRLERSTIEDRDPLA